MNVKTPQTRTFVLDVSVRVMYYLAMGSLYGRCGPFFQHPPIALLSPWMTTPLNGSR